MNNVITAPLSLETIVLRGLGILGVAFTVACKEATPEKAAAAPAPVVVDTSVATIYGIAVNRTPGGSGWCLHTSRPEVGTGRLVKVAFTTERKIRDGKLGERLTSCLGPDSIPGAFAWAINFATDVPVSEFPAIALRDDVRGNIGRNLAAEFDLNGDQQPDTITICTNGTVARFRMKWAGDVPRRGWSHELPYTTLAQPHCPDAAVPAVAVDTQPVGIMLTAASTVGPRYELPYDREWLVLRKQTLGDESHRTELLKTTVLPMRHGSCPNGGGESRRLIASASPSHYIALLSGLPLTEGVIEEATKNHYGSALFADSIRLTLNDKTLLLRRESAGVDGFRIFAETRGAIIRIFEAPSSELGRWYVTWAGDLDRDGDIDFVHTAQARNWQDASYLLLSRHRSPLQWPNAAQWQQDPC